MKGNGKNTRDVLSGDQFNIHRGRKYNGARTTDIFFFFSPNEMYVSQ